MIYGGEQRLKPENLKPLDNTELALSFPKDARPSAVQKMRDILKQAIIMQDGEATYLLPGIENQPQIHCAMPIRNMLCDALQRAVGRDRPGAPQGAQRRPKLR